MSTFTFRFDDPVEFIQYRTTDPTNIVLGKPAPAATTLLYNVCQNDPVRFEEAVRLVGLFIAEALRYADSQRKTP